MLTYRREEINVLTSTESFSGSMLDPVQFFEVLAKEKENKKKESVMYVDNDNDATDFSKKTPLMLQGYFSPSSVIFRYMGIILMCLTGFGSNFCYDNPGALEDYFEKNLDMSTEKFSLLYSVYSWPNIFSCFIGGFLLDSVFGIRWGTFIYMTLTLTGHMIFATATYVNAFWLMLVGRFLFGVGGESLAVALSCYFALWFKDKELNSAVGIQLCFSSLASTLNFLVMEKVYSYALNTLHYAGAQCIGVTLFFTSLACIASMVIVTLLNAMDKKAEKVLRRRDDQSVEIMKLQDVKDFTKTFWIVALFCVPYNMTVFPFLSLAKLFSRLYFITIFELTPTTANTIISLVYIITAVAAPLFGILIDKTGKNIAWIIVSIIGLISAHCLLAFTSVDPHVSMIIFGLSLSLSESSFLPFIALIVPEHQMGTAYGIVGATVNLGLAVGPMICGVIVDNHGYFILQVFFIFCLFVSLVMIVVLWILEKNATVVYSVQGKDGKILFFS